MRLPVVLVLPLPGGSRLLTPRIASRGRRADRGDDLAPEIPFEHEERRAAATVIDQLTEWPRLGVGADYLLVTATRQGLVEPDWPLRFEELVGPAVAPIAATLKAARARKAAGEARQVSEEQVTRQASLELAGTRERLVGELDYAVRTSPRMDLTDEERATIDTAHGKRTSSSRRPPIST
jgi:hypothetical protein